MTEPNRDELVTLLKDLQQKVNTVVEKTNANNGAVEATNSVEVEEPAVEEAQPVEEAAVEEAQPAAETVMGGGRRKRRRTKKQCGGRRKTKGRKGKGRSRRR